NRVYRHVRRRVRRRHQRGHRRRRIAGAPRLERRGREPRRQSIRPNDPAGLQVVGRRGRRWYVWTNRMNVPLLSSVTVPAANTPVLAFCSNTVFVFTVFGFSGSLNCHSSTGFSGTVMLALFTGLTLNTLGATVVVSTTVRNDP